MTQDTTTTTARRLVVPRERFADGHVDDVELTLDDGEVLVRVDRFALTTNNVTYAVAGDELQYWRFFPTGDGTTGIVPVWGVGTVEASRHAEVAAGTRLYGYLPMGTHVVLRPGRVDPGGFMDASPHREGLAGAYQRYERLDVDPLHDDATTDLELLVRPLFLTSFLLDDVLADRDAAPVPPRTVVVTSASSKTGTTLAHLLAARDGVHAVGLTSPGNVATVEATGLWDHVLTYDAVAEVGRFDGPQAFVDLAGNAQVAAAVHAAVADDLVTSLAVGLTHADATDGAPPAHGPRRTFFFAPARAAKRIGDWGREDFGGRVAEAWAAFVAWYAPRVEVREVAGLGAAVDEWAALCDGDVDPAEGIVVVLD